VRNLVSRFEGGHTLRVFENTVLRMFGPRREEDGPWRKLDNELHGLYSSPNIVRMIKSMKWAGHVAYMGRGRCLQGFGWGARS
jgi:hypothetical protein